jgi:hypothetical protein
VVSSCPWKIDAQVTAGVQITLAREIFNFLKINNDENKPFLFLNIKQQKNKLYYTKNDRNNYNKKKTEIKKNKKKQSKNLNKQDKIIIMNKI